MADNIDEEPIDSPTNTESENASDTTEDTKIIKPNQERKNMETHPHEMHKAPGMRWRHISSSF